MDLLQQIQRLGASRAGQSISVGTVSSGVTSIAGSALQNAGTGYLFCRAYNETGRINTISSTSLPDSFTGKPIGATLLTSIDLTNRYFAGANANYSIRIVGSVQPPSTGKYIIRLTTSDGARLYLDGYKLMDSWKSGTTVTTSAVVMYAGNWYAIAIEHCTIANSERLLVEWSLDGSTFTTMTHASDSTNFQFAFDSSESQGSHAASLRIAGQTYMADSLTVASPDRALSPGTITYSGTITSLQADLAGTFTASFWLEFTASASLQTIVNLGGNRLIQINASSKVVLTPNNGPSMSTTILTPSAPVHLVVVTTPTAYSLYVNGALDANYNGTNTSGTLSALSSSVLSINPTPVLANAAILDEFAIWLTALDGPSVSRIFNNGRKVSLRDVSNAGTLYSSLYLWYTFNDEGLAYFSDKGPRSNNLMHGVTVVTSASLIPNAESLSILPGTVLHTHNQVGFGTPNPAAQVHIAGRTTASTYYNGGLLCVNSVDSGNSGIVVRSGLASARPGGNSWLSFDQAGLGGWSMGQDVADSRKLKLVGNASFLSSNPAITIDTSNRVGINQSNPLYALDVVGTVNMTGALFQNGNAFMTSQWTTSNSNIYYSSGNVGIGTNLPAYTLDVAGSSRISGSLTSGSITTKLLSVGLATPGQLFDVRGPSTWGQQRIIPATDGSETSIGFYRYSNVGQAMTGDTWVVGHNTAQAGVGNFGIGCYASSGTLSMLTMTTGTNVGIANTSPQFTLDVGGNINFTGALYKGGSAYVGSQWTTTGTNLYFTGGNVGVANSSPQFTLDVGGNINFTGALYKGGSAYVSSQWTTTGTNLYFTGGNVGISKSNPQYTLDVGGNVNFVGTLSQAGTAYISSQWTTMGTNVYFTGGNVGISKASPQYTLDVGGNINFTGTLLQGGSAYIGSQWTTSGTNLYYAGGNVGISRTSPQYTLDVGGTISGTALTVTNGASISGTLTVGGTAGQLMIDPRGNLTSSGVISNNVNSALIMRVFDETGVYAGIGSLTSGNFLPAPYLSKPISDTQLTSLNLTNTAFGTITGGYSLRIAGYVQPPATGTYLFRATYQEGLTLFLDTKKLVDSWKYTGGTSVAYGTLTMYQNVWSPLVVEHAAATSGERLLIEWSSNAGTTFTTLAAGTTSTTFLFGYDVREAPATVMGTSYLFGKANYSDLGIFNAGVSLPNTSYFSGNSSELNNDAGYIKSYGTLTGTSLVVFGNGSIAGNLMLGTTSTLTGQVASFSAGGSFLSTLSAATLIVPGSGSIAGNLSLGSTLVVASNAIVNGTCTLNGTTTFNAATTFNGTVLNPIQPKAWGYSAPNAQAYGANVTYGAPIIANQGDATLCAAVGGNIFTAPYDGIFSFSVSWGWQNYQNGAGYTTYAFDSVMGNSMYIGIFQGYSNPWNPFTYTQQMVKNQTLAFYMASTQTGGWGVGQMFFYVQTLLKSV